MQPGDRLICCLVESLAVGDRFKEWPLHITIVPWFRLDDDSEHLAKGMSKTLTELVAFSVTATETVMFGPKHNRPAILVEPVEILANAHNHIRSYLHQKRAWLVDETTKKRYDFRPHVTFQGEEKLTTGDEVRVSELFMVEQCGDYKEIVSEISFGS